MTKSMKLGRSAASSVVQLLLVLCSLSLLVDTAPVADRVLMLPLYGYPPTAHYSGYLDATDGCDTSVNGKFCKLHYWFATAEGDDDFSNTDKPVLLWLNGGPGSSSILGWLQELGPLLLNATGGLMDNPWAWTKVAHVFAIESPVGVGYSYCEKQTLDGGVCSNTDKFTASAMRAGLVDFFSNKFPELASHDFYITGESYAGVYIPTLAKEIVDNAFDVVPLKGLAVGDPCTDNVAQADSMNPLWYAHKYGLMPDQDFDLLWHQCNGRSMANPFTSANRDLLLQGNSGNELDTTKFFELLISSPGEELTKSWSDDCNLAWRKFIISSSDALSQGWKDLFIDDYSLFGPVSTVEDDHMADYMNRDDVKQALHVEETPIDTWPFPGDFIYQKEYDACNGDVSDPRSMIDFYFELAPKLEGNIWVYNGDTDPCVSYEGTRLAISRVGFAEVDGGSYRPWFYNHTAAPLWVLAEKARMFGPDLLAFATGAQFGGEVVNYEHGLSFVTIHGSGHMVPQFRPQAALHMISKLIAGEDLSPLLVSNKTLTEMSDDEWKTEKNRWTELAMGPPFVKELDFYEEK